MNILITGASGFIGFHLAKSLLNKRNKIYLTDNFNRGKNDNSFKELIKEPNVYFLKCDLTNKNEFKKFPKNIDYIFHLAAINGTRYFYEIPDQVLRVNTLINLNLLEFLKKNNKTKTIFASSSEVYASTTEFLKNRIPSSEKIEIGIKDISNVRFSYATSKIFGESAFYSYAKVHKIKFSIVRFHNIYGPRMGNEHVIPELIKKIANSSKTLEINGYNNTRSFCYISDAVNSLKIIMNNIDNSIYHVGNDLEEIKILDLAKILSKIMNKKLKFLKLKSPSGSVKRRLPKLKKIYLKGYRPEINLNEGLTKTLEWYSD